jgi:hypothetical protein
MTINRSVLTLTYGPPWPLVFRFANLVDAQSPPFGPLSKLLVILSDLQQTGFSLRILHLVRENSRFFCAGAPVLRVIKFGSHARPQLL